MKEKGAKVQRCKGTEFLAVSGQRSAFSFCWRVRVGCAGRRGRGGFTLIEALVSSLLLGMAAAALCSMSTRCLVSTRLNRGHEMAWSVLDRQMRFVDTMGIDTYVAEGDREGIEEMGGRMFSWRIAVSLEPIGNLYQVTVAVRWVENKRGRQISASTMLNGSIPAVVMN